MRLLEYQSKAIFADFGIPIPRGFVTSNAIHAKKISSQFRDCVVLKAQVHVRGRGGKGGIRLVKNLDEVESTAIEMLGSKINGSAVDKILIEEAVNIKSEFTLSVSIDFENQCPVITASQISTNSHPPVSYSQKIDLLFGPQDFQIRNAAIFMELDRDLWEEFITIVRQIWNIFSALDAQAIDIRPLVITPDKKLIVLDARIDVDDLALARHPEIYEIYDTGIDDEIEIASRKYGIQIVNDQGEIACLTMGKGVAAALHDHFQNICNFEVAMIDLGHAASGEKIDASLEILQKKNQIKAIFLNIFCEFSYSESYFEDIFSSKEIIGARIPVFVHVISPDYDKFLSDFADRNIRVVPSIINGIREICKAIGSD